MASSPRRARDAGCAGRDTCLRSGAASGDARAARPRVAAGGGVAGGNGPRARSVAPCRGGRSPSGDGGRPGGVGRADAARFVVVRFPRSRRLVADLLAARPAAGTAGPGVAPTWRAPTCCGRPALRPPRAPSRLENRVGGLLLTPCL